MEVSYIRAMIGGFLVYIATGQSRTAIRFLVSTCLGIGIGIDNGTRLHTALINGD